jgi:hypothetical protein
MKKDDEKIMGKREGLSGVGSGLWGIVSLSVHPCVSLSPPQRKELNPDLHRIMILILIQIIV